MSQSVHQHLLIKVIDHFFIHSILSIALLPPLFAETVIIKNCYDGDTCTTTKGEKIRLACIDTPELKGNKADPTSAKEARDYLNAMIAGQKVDIRRITKDRYKRTVAELFINKENIQQIMVDNGYASIYKKYASPCTWAK